MTLHAWPFLGRNRPIEVARAEGAYLYTPDGQAVLDAAGGAIVANVGHGRADVAAAISETAARMSYVIPTWLTPERAALVEELKNHWLPSHLNRIHLASGGSEANEAAIKLARKHGHVVRGIDTSNERGPLILTAQASFHGRTLAAVTATGQPKYHQGFEPMVQGFRYFPYNDTSAFEALLHRCEAAGPRVAAVMLEPLQGEGGVNPGDVAFFQRVRDLCDQYKILLIFDEVQVGVGRTGRLWGYQKLGVEPDAFTLAKGLGGGFPIGALCVKAKADQLKPGEHASTFGGNPLACRAGLTVASELQRRNLPAHAEAMGQLLQRQLLELAQRHPQLVKGVRGWGLLQGLVLQADGPKAIDVVKAAMDNGLLLVPAGTDVVRFVPPLTIQPRHLRLAVKRLEKALLACPSPTLSAS